MNVFIAFRRFALFTGLAAVALHGHAQQISVVPTEKFSRDTTVRLRVSTTAPFALGRESVTMSNNIITVTLRSYFLSPESGPLPPVNDVPSTSDEVILGRMPQGEYTVAALFLNRVNGTTTSVGTVQQFSIVDDPDARNSGYPVYDFSDLWWNPEESGWGITIFVKRNALFAAWFAYDSNGNPTWYTLQAGAWRSPKSYQGTIYATHAAPNSGLGPLSGLSVFTVGTGNLDFDGYDNATFTFTVNGVLNSKSIKRQVF